MLPWLTNGCVSAWFWVSVSDKGKRIVPLYQLLVPRFQFKLHVKKNDSASLGEYFYGACSCNHIWHLTHCMHQTKMVCHHQGNTHKCFTFTIIFSLEQQHRSADKINFQPTFINLICTLAINKYKGSLK